MSKKEESKPSKSKMTFIMFQLDGGDDTLQHSFRTISQALGNAFQHARPAAPKLIAGAVVPSESETEAEAVDESNGDAEQTDEATSTAPSKPPRQQKPPTYSFVKDLNLRPTGKPTLREFFAQKAPQDRQEQVVVILYYLTKQLGVTGVGANHIYTGFKEVEQPVPSNIGKTVHAISVRKGWFTLSGTGYILNVGGENFVEHELPRSASN
jgi:hypothetical protein